MRTNIEIDNKLMNDVLKATGLKTKKDAVELGLKTLVRLKKQEGIKLFRGQLKCTGPPTATPHPPAPAGASRKALSCQLKWTGDLDDMRTSA